MVSAGHCQRYYAYSEYNMPLQYRYIIKCDLGIIETLCRISPLDFYFILLYNLSKSYSLSSLYILFNQQDQFTITPHINKGCHNKKTV